MKLICNNQDYWIGEINNIYYDEKGDDEDNENDEEIDDDDDDEEEEEEEENASSDEDKKSNTENSDTENGSEETKENDKRKAKGEDKEPENNVFEEEEINDSNEANCKKIHITIFHYNFHVLSSILFIDFFVDIKWFYRNEDLKGVVDKVKLNFPRKELFYCVDAIDKNPISVIMGHCNVKFCLESISDTKRLDKNTYFCRFFIQLKPAKLFRLYANKILFSPKNRDSAYKFQRRKFPFINFSKVPDTAKNEFSLTKRDIDKELIFAENFPMFDIDKTVPVGTAVPSERNSTGGVTGKKVHLKEKGGKEEGGISSSQDRLTKEESLIIEESKVEKENSLGQPKEKNKNDGMIIEIDDDDSQEYEQKEPKNDEIDSPSNELLLGFENEKEEKDKEINEDNDVSIMEIDEDTQSKKESESKTEEDKEMDEINSLIDEILGTCKPDKPEKEEKENNENRKSELTSDRIIPNSSETKNETKPPLTPNRIKKSTIKINDDTLKSGPKDKNDADNNKKETASGNNNQTPQSNKIKEPQTKRQLEEVKNREPKVSPPPTKYAKFMDEPEKKIDMSVLEKVADKLKKDRSDKTADAFDPSKLQSGESIWTLSDTKEPQYLKSKEVCGLFVKGLCIRGASCQFTHESPEIHFFAGAKKQKPDLEQRIRKSIISKTKVLKIFKKRIPDKLA